MCKMYAMHELEIVKERIVVKLARAEENHTDVTSQLDKSTAALKASRAEAAEAEAARDAARKETAALEARARELTENELTPLLVERQAIADDLERQRAVIVATAAEAEQARRRRAVVCRCPPRMPATKSETLYFRRTVVVETDRVGQSV